MIENRIARIKRKEHVKLIGFFVKMKCLRAF